MHPEMINNGVDAIYDSTEAALDSGIIIPDKPDDTELNERYLLSRTKLWNTVIIDGFAGCGKSTVIHNIALSFFDGINEVAVSKIRARAEGMGLDADRTYSLNELMAKLLGVDKFNESDYIKSDTERTGTAHSHVWSDPKVKINFDAIFGKPVDGQLRVLTIDECTLVKEGL
jgi:Viral (Superfamily 1) RNA helicase.